MKDEKYINELLLAWEETYKKGLMTLWVLLSLKESNKSTEEIMAFVHEKSQGILSFDEQSLYRSLRKFYDLEIVDFLMKDSARGPQKKYYSLTKIGTHLLDKFLERNIRIYSNHMMATLINY